jgi:hypothetical protein
VARGAKGLVWRCLPTLLRACETTADEIVDFDVYRSRRLRSVVLNEVLCCVNDGAVAAYGLIVRCCLAKG